MFKEPIRSTVPPKLDGGDVAFNVHRGTMYYARPNGRIHGSFVLGAYFLHHGWGATIYASHRVPEAWFVAFRGLKHLASSGQEVELFLDHPRPGEVYDPADEDCREYFEVALDGAAPPDGQVLTAGTVFTPSASGHLNIPRLYAMAALFIEHKNGAAVAALITNASGFVIARGTKDYGDVGCGHAEVRAIFSILGQLPDSGALFSTLKPCTMCAGLLHATTGVNFRKYWARGDPTGGADWSKVPQLTLPASLALSANTQTSQRVRAIKLSDESIFADEFSAAWTGRAAALGQQTELQNAAFIKWRDANIKAGRALVPNSLRVVPDDPDAESARTVAARTAAIGSITTLLTRSDLFQRMDKGQWKNGLDQIARDKIAALYENSAGAKAVSKTLRDAKAADDMGIVRFIAEHRQSVSLSSASHQVMAAKFAKYGKSAAAIEAATGLKGAVPSSAKPPTAPMQQVVDYLFEFLKTQ